MSLSDRVIQTESNSFGNRIVRGMCTLAVSVAILYFINALILYFYHPNTNEILQQVVAQTIFPATWFRPEPVERLQFLASVVSMPFLVFFLSRFFAQFSWLKALSKKVTVIIAAITLGLFVVYLLLLFKRSLVYLTHKTAIFYFRNTVFGHLNIVLSLVLFCTMGILFLNYARLVDSIARKLVSELSMAVVVLGILVANVMYSILNVGSQRSGILMETNAVFYSVTQVFAGKSLLVNLNAQYGLYAWFLNPVFKIIGLSAVHFSLVMGGLSALSFLFIYLTLRKVFRSPVLAFITFLSVVFWQYWQTRLPLRVTPAFFYQYTPLRLFFPALCMYLFVVYTKSSQSLRPYLLALLALFCAAAVLWNPDSGIVVFGAAFAGLVYFSVVESPSGFKLRKILVVGAAMFGVLLLVVGCFLLSTKLNSGHWPEFAKAFTYQQIFYQSGFFMLPMKAFHFWNLPVLVYIIAAIYLSAPSRLHASGNTSLAMYLVVLGCGLFAYFQGRSWDLTITVVMYPAILLLGFFCDLLSEDFSTDFKGMVSLRSILFLFPFLFLADGACAMMGKIVPVLRYGLANVKNSENNNIYQRNSDFLLKNIRLGDTVLIISRNYESFYYAVGLYYNPVRGAGSTELFFKSDVSRIGEMITTAKYPVVYDRAHEWSNKDSLINLLGQYEETIAENEDHTLLLYRPKNK